MLPDDVLLEIFDFHANESVDEAMDEAINEATDKDMFVNLGIVKKPIMERWITLAHVCPRWRNVIFQSPGRLNLRLLCTPKTPAEDTLDIWPPLPLVVVVDSYDTSTGSDNILAVLEHNHRVCQIELSCESGSELEYYTNSTAMQEPFPELTHLQLQMWGNYESKPILPDSFLGGNAPHLRSLELDGVPFPGLPKLLLSATHLVQLDLSIPRSGYIPPEALSTGLSALTNLQSLYLRFQSPGPRPALDSRRPPPLTHSILPSITKIHFKGTSEYLEEILARIDVPRLNGLHIIFFNDVVFDTPQLFQLISRRPALRTPQKGHIAFNSEDIVVKFQSQTSDYDVLSVKILCTASDLQLSSIEQVCTPSLPLLSTLEDLFIFENRRYPPLWQGDVDNTLWLEVLHPFAAVKNLYLCENIAPRITPALQELVGARMTEELPTLENIFIEGLQQSGPVQEGIEKFLTARQLTGRPITVSSWDRNTEWFEYPYYFAKSEL